jgi:hypothetical protein
VWEPSTWDDIVAAIGTLAEGQALDFKAAAALATTKPANDEVAKDIAAMSVGGGVVAYGIQEANEIATSAGGVPIAGQANRIHQILGTRVTPPVTVSVRTIEDPSTPGEGVVIVLVPPSVNAPHYCNEQFPVRSGTTTRNLTEREIADLYLRRQAVIAEQSGGGRPVEAPPPAWFTAPGLDMTDVSVMRVTVGPVGPNRLDYRLADQLREAATQAEKLLGSMLRPVPPVPGIFVSWKPFEARGLRSGESLREGAHLSRPTYTATLLYGSGFSFLVTCPVRVNGTKHVYEALWAEDLIGALALAGTFYSANSTVALVRVDVHIGELDDAHPGPREGWFPGNPVSLPAYHEHTVTPVAELATAPVDAAAELLDRFFAAILPHGPGLRGRLGIPE